MILHVKVARGALKLPGQSRKFVRKGERVPAGAIPAAEVEALLAAGVLVVDEETGAEVLGEPARSAGRWRHDPAHLAGRSAEELRVMILDEDPTFDLDGLGVPDMVLILTADYEPILAVPKSESRDRHRPSDSALRVARARATR
jgi:hypothetical protein